MLPLAHVFGALSISDHLPMAAHGYLDSVTECLTKHSATLAKLCRVTPLL